MSNATITVSAGRPALSLKLLAAGLVASLVFAMWEMIIEAFVGAGFWATPVYIGATVLRDLQNVGMPVPFNLLGVILGLMGHVGNGAIFALIFAFLIAPRIGSLIGRIVAGVGYGAVVFLVTWFVILPLIDPVMLNLNAVVFFLGHVIWGIALGGLNYWATARA